MIFTKEILSNGLKTSWLKYCWNFLNINKINKKMYYIINEKIICKCQITKSRLPESI